MQVAKKPQDAFIMPLMNYHADLIFFFLFIFFSFFVLTFALNAFSSFDIVVAVVVVTIIMNLAQYGQLLSVCAFVCEWRCVVVRYVRIL